jgi:hypothetical protein
MYILILGIYQYHSEDDPFIPISEANYVAQSLKLENNLNYFIFKNSLHFFTNKSVKPIINHLINII